MVKKWIIFCITIATKISYWRILVVSGKISFMSPSVLTLIKIAIDAIKESKNKTQHILS